MPQNTTRAKPYTLSGEPTAYMVEQINEMFDMVFQDAELNETRALLASGISDVEADGPTRGDIISAQVGTDDVVRWTVLSIGADATFLRSNGSDASWTAIVESDITDGSILARIAANETITGTWTFNENVTLATANLIVGGSGSFTDDLTVGTSVLVVDVSAGTLIVGSTTTDLSAPGIDIVSATTPGVALTSYNSVSAATAGFVTFRRARDTEASPDPANSGDSLGGVFWQGRLSAAAWSANVGGIRVLAAENFSSGNNGTHMVFEVTATGAGTRTERLRITAAGLINVATDAALGLVDTNASHHLRLSCGSNLTADRTLTFTTGDSARTITLNGNPTLNNWFDQDVRTSASPSFVSPIGTTSLIIGAATTAGVRLDLESGLLAIREGDDSAYVGFNSGAATINGRATINGFIIADEQDADPGTSDLDSLDSVAIYMKNNKFVIAYNNGGTITYITIPMDGSTTTWTHNTSAP